MRNLVIDFDLTVLCPLLLLSAIALWSSGRAFLSARVSCRASIKRIERPFETKEAVEEFVEWGRSRCADMREYRKLVGLFVGVVVVLCAAMWMPDRWKIELAYPVWDVLWFASWMSFIITIFVAWHYAEKSDWLRFGICLLAMLMAAASTEHFDHQRMNARHVACPHCSDDDDRPDDN